MKLKHSVKFTFTGKRISKKKVLKAWKIITNKPFPFGRIKASLVKNEEFERVLNKLKKHTNIRNQSDWEYGEETKNWEVQAIVFGGGVNDYYVLIRRDSKLTLEENLKHELCHIAKGEVTLHG